MRVRLRDGTRLYFDVAGMGLVPEGPLMRERPTLLCLHGGPGFDHSLLKSALAPLADTAQVVFLDHRGQGRSDRSAPDRWNLDTWIEDVVDFCGALELEHPVVLGQSFGGVVALGVAIRHPDLVARLIVSSSIGRSTTRRRSIGRDRAYRPAPGVGCHFFCGEGFTYDWFGELEPIRCPSLILAGALDPITTLADHDELAEAIRGSRLEVFADAGHVFRDKPGEALSVIREFVAAPS